MDEDGSSPSREAWAAGPPSSCAALTVQDQLQGPCSPAPPWMGTLALHQPPGDRVSPSPSTSWRWPLPTSDLFGAEHMCATPWNSGWGPGDHAQIPPTDSQGEGRRETLLGHKTLLWHWAGEAFETLSSAGRGGPDQILCPSENLHLTDWTSTLPNTPSPFLPCAWDPAPGMAQQDLHSESHGGTRSWAPRGRAFLSCHVPLAQPHSGYLEPQTRWRRRKLSKSQPPRGSV